MILKRRKVTIDDNGVKKEESKFTSSKKKSKDGTVSSSQSSSQSVVINKSFSLRERNKIKEKSRDRKESLMELNERGIENSTIPQNTFHNDRPKTHLDHTRTKLENR